MKMMITIYDTINAMCEYVENMGGKCQTYREYRNFLKEHHVNTSRFPLPLGYFSFSQFINEMIEEEESMDESMEDFLNRTPMVTNRMVALDIMAHMNKLGGSCDTLLESVHFLHDHNFDFSQIGLPEGCKDFEEYEHYLVESDELCRKIGENIPPDILNDPNLRFFDH